MKVKLQDIIEAMKLDTNEFSAFINKNSLEIVEVTNESLALTEDGEDIEDLPEWEQEEVKLAYEIIGNDEDYIELPTSEDINEYAIMKKFCLNITDQKVKNTLLKIIQGKGAFQRFKNTVQQLGLEKEWYLFRDHEYEKIAIDFCEANGIEFEKLSTK